MDSHSASASASNSNTVLSASTRRAASTALVTTNVVRSVPAAAAARSIRSLSSGVARSSKRLAPSAGLHISQRTHLHTQIATRCTANVRENPHPGSTQNPANVRNNPDPGSSQNPPSHSDHHRTRRRLATSRSHKPAGQDAKRRLSTKTHDQGQADFDSLAANSDGQRQPRANIGQA